jgi:GAF domain-containing protein
LVTLPRSRWYGLPPGPSTGRETTLEQAALRRIAALVGQGVQPHELFAVVAEEVSRVLDAASVAVARYEPDDAATMCGTFPPQGPLFRTGARVPLEGAGVLGLICEHAQPARVDNDVGAPIMVAGRVWGAIVASNTERLPESTEARLVEFTGLLAAAIANAEAREALARLADEHAALRRVATLVAQGARPVEVFWAVSDEIGGLFGTQLAAVGRFEPDGRTLDLVGAGKTHERWELTDFLASAEVLRTGRSARADAAGSASAEGETAERIRSLGIISTVASPIVVDGELWGSMLVASTDKILPPDTEARLENFTELVATAIANAESRGALARIADEQAALRRVATLVAEGAPPDALFRAVADEVGSVVGPSTVTLSHHHADGSFTVVAARDNPGFPVGSRWPMDGPSLAATIHETGRTARIDDYSSLGGAVAAAMEEASMRAAAGSPIVVDGKVWGHISVATMGAEPLPAGTEQRLLDFTELISTAISNAESRDALARLADEQAALRRVATLIARDAPPGDVFNSVAEEVGKLLDTDVTVVGRYDGDGAATATGSWSSSPGEVPVGTRSVVGGRNVLTLVAETEKPARIDGYEDTSGEAAEIARRYGWRSSIAAPIIVEGRLWGVMLVATKRPEPFPAGAEDRLAAFTDLVATALANAQAHDEVRRFGEEQAALGRVATLVAAGATPEQVFKSVVDQTSRLLGLELVAFGRIDSDDTATIVATSTEYPVSPGTTWSLNGPSVIATVARTKRAARIDDYSGLGGQIADAARSQGFRSAIGAPLTVEGRLWGAIVAYSRDAEPIPERSEARLGQFTELVATAVANAEARQALERVAAEQAALRRVATLVARGIGPEEVFRVVAAEVGVLFGADVAAIVRFEDHGMATVLGDVGGPHVSGKRVSLDEGYVVHRVRETGESSRFDTEDPSTADMPSLVRAIGIRSAVASPIVVEGGLWGAITAASAKGPLPPSAERRLTEFTELVATAVSNTQAREQVTALVDEQAALRRVATLVAQGVRPGRIFAAVGEEISGLFGSSLTMVGRFEHDARALVVVGAGAGATVGARWQLDDLPASGRVFRTERSVRVDDPDYSEAPESLAAIGRRFGVVSTVASPIFVEGRLWGVVSVSYDKQLPPEAEDRLEKFSELVATAIGNAESSAELAASRRRIVAAADEARRRIERDLHDGIQQRLIALSFRARAMTRRPRDELPEIAAELAEGLKDVSDELREVSRGIHPTILTEAGLGPALRALARRSNVPIDVDVRLEKRLPAPIEAAAYYIASEALANVAKHANANVVKLVAAHDNGVLTLEVCDDGIGGVDADRGSGILGLTDRVEALGGTISITSPPRVGTTLSVGLPVTG